MNPVLKNGIPGEASSSGAMPFSSNRVKVLIFSIVYYPRFIGGAEVAVKEITDRLPEIEFDMIALRNGDKTFERIGNVNIYRVGPPSWFEKKGNPSVFPMAKYIFPFLAFFKALSLHRKNHYDASWAIMANYAGFGALFFKWARPGVRFILTLQEGDPVEHIRRRVGPLFPLLKQIFVKADRVQAISHFLADWAEEMGHRGQVEMIPNGVDVKKFLPTINHQLPTTGPVTLITTSRLVEKNGVGDVIEALSLLPENVHFKILGSGPLESDLKLKTKNLNLQARIEFLGFVPQDEIPSHLHEADIFIRPSLSEGFGNSFIEAMAAGLPVIATPVGGIPDFLKDPSNTSGQVATGFFCEPGNPQSIAETVERMLANPDLVERVKVGGMKMVEEKYDWDLVAQEMRNKVFLNL